MKNICILFADCILLSDQVRMMEAIKLSTSQVIVLANTTETPDVADILALDNALTLDSDGWALLAPFGEHKKERIANLNGVLTHEKYIQIVDQASVDTVLANEKGTNIFAKLKHALVKRPIYRDHPDLKLYAPETVQSGNQKMSPLGVNDGCRKTDRGLEFRPMLAPEGATAVSEDGCKFPSAVFLLKKTGVVRDGGWIEVRPFALASIGLTANPNISGVDSLANSMIETARDAAKQTDEQKQATKDTIMKQLLIGWLAAQGVALANDAADQIVFDAFNKEMLTRSSSITTLGNDKQSLTGTVNTLTGDKAKLVAGATLPADLVTAANQILALGNAQTEATMLKKKFCEASVDVIITQGKAPVADRTKEVDALLALGNDKLDAALTELGKRPVKFAVTSSVDANRKAGATVTNAAAAREEILTLANSSEKYKSLPMDAAMKLIEKDRPDLFEVLRAAPGEEKPRRPPPDQCPEPRNKNTNETNHEKIQLKIAVVCSALSALWHRNSGALALANDNPPNPPEEKAAEVNAAEELKQRNADEAAIKEMVAGGLERSQAEAALRHKKDFTIRHAEVQAENKSNRRR